MAGVSATQGLAQILAGLIAEHRAATSVIGASGAAGVLAVLAVAAAWPRRRGEASGALTRAAIGAAARPAAGTIPGATPGPVTGTAAGAAPQGGSDPAPIQAAGGHSASGGSRPDHSPGPSR